MKRNLIAGLFVRAFAGTGAVYAMGGTSPNRPATTVAATKQAVFAIENMTCAACPITVRKAMEGVAGVASVAVDFNKKTATVAYDPARTNLARIAAASTNAGYPARAAQN